MPRRMPHHPLRPCQHLRQLSQNLGENSLLNVPKRRKCGVESVTQEDHSLKPAEAGHPVVMPNQRLAVKAAHPRMRIVKARLVVAQHPTLAVKETVAAHPNPVKVKTVLRCIAMAVGIAVPAHAMEIVVTNPVLVTARNILRCSATEIVTAITMANEVNRPATKASVVSFMQIVDRVKGIAARSADLVTATLRIVAKGLPDITLTAGITSTAAASDLTHASASAHSRRVGR